MEMTPSDAEKKLNLEPALDVAEVTAEVGVWVSLDLDAWSSYNKFTLRASWPAYVSVWDLFFLFILWDKIIGKAQLINHFSSIPVIYTWKFMILCRWRLNNGTINHFTQHATSTFMYTLSVQAFLHLPRLVRIWRGFVVNPFPSLWSWSPYSSGFFLNLCFPLFLWCSGPLEWHLHYCLMFYAIMILFLSTSGESSTPSKNDGWPVTLEHHAGLSSIVWLNLVHSQVKFVGTGSQCSGLLLLPLASYFFLSLLGSLSSHLTVQIIYRPIHTYIRSINNLIDRIIDTRLSLAQCRRIYTPPHFASFDDTHQSHLVTDALKSIRSRHIKQAMKMK